MQESEWLVVDADGFAYGQQFQNRIGFVSWSDDEHTQYLFTYSTPLLSSSLSPSVKRVVVGLLNE